MIVAILTRTPPAVWALLIVLLALGLRQRSARRIGRSRALLLPAMLAALSLYGALALTASTLTLAAWSAGAALGMALVLRRALAPAAAYDRARAEFFLPGSSAPLLTMMAAFMLNYAVNVALAVHPALRRETLAAAAICAAYGLLGGLFLGRAARLWRLSAAA